MQNIISQIEAVQRAQIIRPLTEINERECLARLAAEVPADGLIVEIGCLYGGTTAVLALANPAAHIVCIDTFEWHPEDDVPASAELLLANMEKIGAQNVAVRVGDSRKIGRRWEAPIDLLWIDGGHSFDWVYPDLSNFGPHAKVIALHDFKNPFWESIEQAVSRFLSEHAGWKIMEVVGTVAVLRRA